MWIIIERNFDKERRIGIPKIGETIFDFIETLTKEWKKELCWQRRRKLDRGNTYIYIYIYIYIYRWLYKREKVVEEDKKKLKNIKLE